MGRTQLAPGEMNLQPRGPVLCKVESDVVDDGTLYPFEFNLAAAYRPIRLLQMYIDAFKPHGLQLRCQPTVDRGAEEARLRRAQVLPLLEALALLITLDWIFRQLRDR